MSLLLTAGAADAVAQDANDLMQMPLDDLLSVSTATASGGVLEERTTASGNVIIISRQTIEENGWRSLADVMANVPGLYLIDDGAVQSVGVRGVTGGLRAGTRLIKIMINGTPVSFRPDERAFIGPEFIPMMAVDRIEIIKGPLSALYGANAFVATVNVVSREPTYGTSTDVSATAVVTNGPRFGYGASIVSSHASDRGTLVIGFSAYRIDRSGVAIQHTFNQQNVPDERWNNLFSDTSRNAKSSPSSLFASGSVNLKKAGTLRWSGGVQVSDSAAEFQLNSTLTHASRESLQNNWLNLRHDWTPSERLTTQLNVALSSGKPTADDELYLTDNFTRTFSRHFAYRSIDPSFFATYSRGDRFSLRAGLDVEVDSEDVFFYTVRFNAPFGNLAAGDTMDVIPDNEPRRVLLKDTGAYALVTTRPLASLPNLHFTVNGRVDRVSYGDFGPPLQISGRMSAAYKWGPWLTAKLVGGRAFQSPSGVLMFAQPGFGVANNVIGALTLGSSVRPLVPQTLDSGELMLYSVLGEHVALEVAAFFQRLRDKIEFRTAGTDYVARNVGTKDYAGVEGSLQLQFWRFSPFVNAAFMRTVGVQAPERKTLVAYPEKTATAGADVELLLNPRLHLNLRVRYVGPRAATDPNIIANLSVPYDLPKYITTEMTVSTGNLRLLGAESKTKFLINAKNLFNEKHSEPGFGRFDVPAPRRTFFFDVVQSY